jgi:hypothetical protein
MDNGTLVVTIKPPTGMSSEGFRETMQKEIFPRIPKDPTRVGAIVSWAVLAPFDSSGTGAATNSEYVWLINWDGLEGSANLATPALDRLRSLGFSADERNLGSIDLGSDAAV